MWSKADLASAPMRRSPQPAAPTDAQAPTGKTDTTGPPGAPPPPTPVDGRIGPRRCGLRMALALAAFLAAVTVVPALACSSSSNGDAEPPTTTDDPRRTTTTSSTATTTPPTPEEQVEAAYLRATDNLYRAAQAADVDHPGLAETSTGPSLKRFREILGDYRKRGVTVEYIHDEFPRRTVSDIKILRSDRAQLRVCIVDNARQVRSSDGTVVDGDVWTRLNRAELRRRDGNWVLFSQEGLKRWKDGAGCDR